MSFSWSAKQINFVELTTIEMMICCYSDENFFGLFFYVSHWPSLQVINNANMLQPNETRTDDILGGVSRNFSGP